ncbi:hypothetical protein UFOVP274_72 [uncultured Caudovirales phage]|uniref:Uncharacterized protein n=1 Tax=uncultured Caudovirales phage TaxID=2100421 RepID=A0A6J5LMP0_9CAUD|nr:hypothetical protein UFOVP274_72 [uncultured Caudovirales phage]
MQAGIISIEVDPSDEEKTERIDALVDAILNSVVSADCSEILTALAIAMRVVHEVSNSPSETAH